MKQENPGKTDVASKEMLNLYYFQTLEKMECTKIY